MIFARILLVILGLIILMGGVIIYIAPVKEKKIDGPVMIIGGVLLIVAAFRAGNSQVQTS